MPPKTKHKPKSKALLVTIKPATAKAKAKSKPKAASVKPINSSSAVVSSISKVESATPTNSKKRRRSNAPLNESESKSIEETQIIQPATSESDRKKKISRIAEPVVTSPPVDPRDVYPKGLTREFEFSLCPPATEFLIGIDEAGRGCLSGPVVAACCFIPRDIEFPGLNDSKLLSARQRELMFAQLTSDPRIRYSIKFLDHEIIDEINILEATMRAMKFTIEEFKGKIDFVLIDGNRIPKELPVPAQFVIGGDSKCFSIAAASVLAKVSRDRFMVEMNSRFPGYQFDVNKGYGVRSHVAAIFRLGPCEIHRKTFAPIKHMLARKEKPSGQKNKKIKNSESSDDEKPRGKTRSKTKSSKK